MNNYTTYILILLLILSIVSASSYPGHFNNAKNSLDFSEGAIFQDSLKLQKLDSLKHAIDSALLDLNSTDKLDSIKLKHFSQLLAALDSLKQGAPEEGLLIDKVDSIKHLSLQKVQEKLKIANVKLSDQEKAFLQKHGLALEDVVLLRRFEVTDLAELPGSNVVNNLSPELDELKNSTGLQNGLPSIPNLQGGVPEEVKQVIDQAAAVKDKLGSIKEDIKEVKENGLERTENLDELAEESLRNIKEVKAIEGQLSAAEKLKQAQQLELEKITNAQQLREQLASGKVLEKVMASEEQVKAHMEKMAKYKKKFDQLPDIRYAPKLKPNAMKGRPLKERIVPGMLFQIVKSDETVSWFLAPEVLYKFSGTFSGGFAGVYRFQYTLSPKVVWDNPLYGYKVIGQAKTWKSFYLRTEFERLNYFRPTGPTIDPKGRYWDTNWLVGVGRTQRISNRIHGHIWALYNVNRDPSDIFNNRVILKSGIQFNLVNDYKKVVQYVEEKVKKKDD